MATYGPEVVEAFCIALAATGRIDQACKAAGIARSSAFKWRKLHEAFAERWVEALDEGTTVLEDEMVRRAVDGDTSASKKSDVLLIFALKARRPEIYRDNASLRLTGPNDGPVQVTETDRATRVSALVALAQRRKAAELDDLA